MIDSLDVFPWHEHFNTGITRIDQQHRRLVELLNQLSRHLLISDDDTLQLEQIFRQLTDYALFHFQEEEIIWAGAFGQDPWLTQHQAIHSQFLDRVKQLKRHQRDLSKEEEIQEIVTFLTNWLAFHILDTDRRMAATVLAMEQGHDLETAKAISNRQLDNASNVMIKGVLDMYQTLSARSLQLLRENQLRQQAENRLRLAGSALESTLEGIVITDAQLNIVNANTAFCHAVRQSREQLQGVRLDAIKPALSSSTSSELIWCMVRDSGHWSGELWQPTEADASAPEWLTLSAIKNEQNEIEHYVAIFSNIAELIERQQALESIANHDPLTGLPNRRLLADRVQQAIHHAQRRRNLFALCYLDLDGFKPVNDVLGHAAGDLLLKEVAERLLANVRRNDTVARLGGDEFVLLFSDLTKRQDIEPLLDRILSAIQQPVLIEDNEASVNASLGVSFFPLDSDNAQQLADFADQALYQAKHAGKGRYQLYLPA